MEFILKFLKSIDPAIILGGLAGVLAFLFGQQKMKNKQLKETIKANEQVRQEEKKYEKKSVDFEEEIVDLKDNLKENDDEKKKIVQAIENNEEIVIDEEEI